MEGASNPASLPLTPALDPRVRGLLSSMGRPRRLAANEVALHRGRLEPFVHVVVSGVLLVEAGIEHIPLRAGSRPVRRSPVAVLMAGDVFGEWALAELSPTGWAEETGPEVRALTSARVLAVPIRTMGELLDSDRHVRLWLLERLVARVRRTEALLASVLSGSVAERVEAVLFALAPESHGAGVEPAEGPIRLGLPLTQGLLAELTGSTRESMNRAIKALVSEGRIARSGRTYTLFPEAVRANRSSPASPIRTTRPSASSFSRWASTEREAAG